jgi:hypothetical protein
MTCNNFGFSRQKWTKCYSKLAVSKIYEWNNSWLLHIKIICPKKSISKGYSSTFCNKSYTFNSSNFCSIKICLFFCISRVRWNRENNFIWHHASFLKKRSGFLQKVSHYLLWCQYFFLASANYLNSYLFIIQFLNLKCRKF